jgi:hypothetical protein
MAEVFLGISSGVGGFTKLVVVKRMPQLAEEPEFVQMFMDEAASRREAQPSGDTRCHSKSPSVAQRHSNEQPDADDGRAWLP